VADQIIFSNVTVVRNQEGELSVYVGSEKMLGVSAVQMNSGVMSLAMPMNRVRLAENNPATPVLVVDNVVDFANFRKAQAASEAPQTDGDVA
jgi:hypothetical protein